MFDMINIFEVFLPQLLRYPNPTDPLNGEAAALLMRDPKTYDIKVKGELVSFLDCRQCKDILADNFAQSTCQNTPQKMPRTMLGKTKTQKVK